METELEVIEKCQKVLFYSQVMGDEKWLFRVMETWLFMALAIVRFGQVTLMEEGYLHLDLLCSQTVI
ncbi:MAG: hypothetical protein GDA48_02115 [Hormoscilla sp. GM102CHS1]|nr:hypothetical protein [Hormoscilla sp. GM102CHS1]